MKAPRRPDPVASISAVMFGLIGVGLIVLAVLVVTTHRIDQATPTNPLPSWASQADGIAQFAMWLAIAFFAVLAFNIAAAAMRHVRRLRQGI